MRIVIAGAGEVGFYLAKLLSNESHDIVLIDDNGRIFARVQDELDVIGIKGDACSIRILREAEVESADQQDEKNEGADKVLHPGL